MIELTQLRDQTIDLYLQSTDAQIKLLMENNLRKLGIKGEFTKGRLRWHGIRMHITEYEWNKTGYQLFQRGVAVSPELIVTLETGGAHP